MRISSGLGLGLVRSADETARRGGRLSEEKTRTTCAALERIRVAIRPADPNPDPWVWGYFSSLGGVTGPGEGATRSRALVPGTARDVGRASAGPGAIERARKTPPRRAVARARDRDVAFDAWNIAKADRPPRRPITPPVEEIVGGSATPRALRRVGARVTGGGRRPRARLPRVPSDTARRRGAAPRLRGARRSPRRGTSSRTLRTSSRARRCPWPSTRRSCDRSPSPPPRPRRPRPARSAREASGRPRTRTRDPRCRSSSRSSRPRAREGECFPGDAPRDDLGTLRRLCVTDWRQGTTFS